MFSEEIPAGLQKNLREKLLEEFNKYGEIKTYWVNGKNLYSYNQRWEDGEGVFQDQSKINEAYKKIKSLI